MPLSALALLLLVAASPPPTSSVGDSPFVVEAVTSAVPEVEALVRQRLPELARCLAFVQWDQKVPADFEQRDDLVQLDFDARSTVEPGEPARPRPWALSFTNQKSAASQRLTPDCVKGAVERWLTDAQLAALAAVEPAHRPALSLRAHFRPTAAQRAAIAAANTRDYAKLCEAFAGLHPDGDLKAAWLPAREHVEPGLREEVDFTFALLSRLKPVDQRTIGARGLAEIAEAHGVARPCHALRGWSPATDAEVLDSDTPPPTTACAARVRQLEAIAAKPPPGYSPPDVYLPSTRGRPLLEAGLVVELASGRRSGSELAAAKLEQVRAQGRPRPLVYFQARAEDQARELVRSAQAWGRDFEVRLLVSAAPPFSHRLAKSAWPEAVSVLERGVANGDVGRVLGPLEAPGSPCAPLREALLAADAAPPSERLARQAAALSRSLKACGCPHPWSEVAFARFTVAADAWTQAVGWVPLSVVEDPVAKELVLDPKSTVGALLAALGEKPVRVTWR